MPLHLEVIKKKHPLVRLICIIIKTFSFQPLYRHFRHKIVHIPSTEMKDICSSPGKERVAVSCEVIKPNTDLKTSPLVNCCFYEELFMRTGQLSQKAYI